MLLGNYSVLNKAPGRSFSGSSVSDTRPNSGTPGSVRGRFLHFDHLSAEPNGYLPPYSWILTQTAGGMSSYTLLNGAGTTVFSIAGGVNGAATLAGVGSVTADGSVIKLISAALAGLGGASATWQALTAAGATLAGTGTLAGPLTYTQVLQAVATLAGVGGASADISALVQADILATLSGAGSVSSAAGTWITAAYASATLAGAGDVVASLTALGQAVATIIGEGSISNTPYAEGNMSANISPFTVLSPESLAAAVWTSVATAYTDPATMGGELNFLHALANNKVVTDPTAGTITVYEADGTTVMRVANLWETVDGSQAYRGTGADRRDGFA